MEPTPIIDEQTEAIRCPGCGRRTEVTEAARCEHCHFDLAVCNATSEDLTPYAASHGAGESDWWGMCRWVFSAGASRIGHVALMQSSPAARRFAFANVLLLSFVGAMVLAAHTGWQVTRQPAGVTVGPGGEPDGHGWLGVLNSRHPSSEGFPLAVQVWWNPAQAIVAFAGGLVSALAAAWVMLSLCRGAVELAHRRRYRGQGRMSAALCYSTAWIVPLLPAGLLLLLGPLRVLGEAGRWSWRPPEPLLLVGAGAIAALAVVLWWFWLIRLSAAAPADTRGRVSATFLLIIPVMIAASAIGWWIGMNRLLAMTFDAWNLSF